MQTHKHILKYLRQDIGRRFVGKMGIGAVLGLLFVTLALSIHVPGAYAYAHTPCAKSDKQHVVVQGDTLSWIAYLYHTNWSALASHNHIVNPDLIYTDQVVCIPVQGFSTATQAQAVSTAPQRQPVTHNDPPKMGPIVTPVAVTPVVVPPTPVPYSPPPTATPAPVVSGSIPTMISQIFGASGQAAINVARCESGLNPGAYNPSGASGLFQIMPSTWAGTSQAGLSPYNAQANALAAHEIFVRDGYSWREWTCQP